MDLKNLGWVGVNWIHLAEDKGKLWAAVNMVMNFLVP
jgi:hypothetical protein